MTLRKRWTAAFLVTANSVLLVSACAPHRSVAPGRICETGLVPPAKILVRYDVEGGYATTRREVLAPRELAALRADLEPRVLPEASPRLRPAPAR